jgi:hypothetical protein
MKPHEVPVYSDILSHLENARRCRGRSRLTYEQAIQINLKKWNISKELALDISA